LVVSQVVCSSAGNVSSGYNELPHSRRRYKENLMSNASGRPVVEIRRVELVDARLDAATTRGYLGDQLRRRGELVQELAAATSATTNCARRTWTR
jgi:hypothetical protein